MNTFIICASGPSLNKSDCELISGSRLPVIAVNSTWRAVPDCEYIYAGDLRWWDANIDVLPSSASRWTCNYRAHKRYGLNLFDTDTRWAFNSGQRSILFAASQGAKNIILLGFDCSINGGSHWHGDHVGLDNPTAESVTRWRGGYVSGLSASDDGKAGIIFLQASYRGDRQKNYAGCDRYLLQRRNRYVLLLHGCDDVSAEPKSFAAEA